MLASTIQFTTNPPTPTQEPPQPGAPDRSGNQGALPQNPDSMPPPHTPSTRGHPPPADHHNHNSRSSPPERACLLCQHQATNHPAHQCTTVSHPAFREEQPPAGPDPYSGPDNNDQEATPHTTSILRKEVIQPHLPVRLPCYDFVPITSPTFDRSP